jgi:hypothetical protein
MSTVQHYRAKAAEYAELAMKASSPNEALDLRRLEHAFVELADNEQWVTKNHAQTLHAPAPGDADEGKLTIGPGVYQFAAVPV